MNLDKDRINELVREVNKYSYVYLPEENYTVATTSHKKVIGKNECFGKGIRFYKEKVLTNDVFVFSVKVNFEPETKKRYCGTGNYTDMVNNNLVLLTQDQLLEHMNYLREVLGLSFDITYIKRKNTYLKITFNREHIRNVCQLRLILFWLREAYAFPYNMYLIDSYKLHNRHPEIELYNLMTIPILSSTNPLYELNFSRYRDFISSKELRDHLQYENLCLVNDESPRAQCLFKRLSPARKSRLDTALNRLHLIESPADIACQIGGGRALRFMSWWNNTDRFELFEQVLQKRLEI